MWRLVPHDHAVPLAVPELGRHTSGLPWRFGGFGEDLDAGGAEAVDDTGNIGINKDQHRFIRGLVLLHEVSDGAADRSYGIAVAKLSGLPPAVVGRARSVLAKLEAGRDATGGIAAGLDDLPLFASAAEPEHTTDPVATALEAIDPDALTPREALEELYRLKRLAAESGS